MPQGIRSDKEGEVSMMDRVTMDARLKILSWAEAYAEQERDPCKRAGAFTSLCHCASRLSRKRVSLRYLRMALLSLRGQTDGLAAHYRRCIARLYARTGRINVALRVVGQLDPTDRPRLICGIALGAVRAGRRHEAMALIDRPFRAMVKKSNDLYSLCRLVECEYAIGRRPYAARLLQRIWEDLTVRGSWVADVHACLNIAWTADAVMADEIGRSARSRARHEAGKLGGSDRLSSFLSVARAYGEAMASRYNLRDLPKAVFSDDI